MRDFSARAFFLCLLAAVVTSRVEACQCGAIPSPEIARDRATAVFEGVVARKQPVLVDAQGWLTPLDRYTFEVIRVWKGAKVPTIALLQHPSNCALLFSGGHRYLVYAEPHEFKRGELSSTICSRTTESRQARADIAALGAPAVSYPEKRPPSDNLFRKVSRVVRAYAVAGTAVMVNSKRHGELSPFPPVTSFGIALWVWILSVGSSALLFMFRRRRMAAVLAVLALLLPLAYVAMSAHRILQNHWFEHLLRWHLPAA